MPTCVCGSDSGSGSRPGSDRVSGPETSSRNVSSLLNLILNISTESLHETQDAFVAPLARALDHGRRTFSRCDMRASGCLRCVRESVRVLLVVKLEVQSATVM